MSAIVERWYRFGDQAWTRDGRLGLRLIVASALVTILIAFLGPLHRGAQRRPRRHQPAAAWFIPVAWGKAIGLPLSEWIVVPVLWVSITAGGIGLVLAYRAVLAGWRPRVKRLVWLGVGLNLATAFTLPLTSADVLMYAAYGRIQRQGLDPYTITPAEIFRQSFDPVLVWTDGPGRTPRASMGPSRRRRSGWRTCSAASRCTTWCSGCS